MAAVATLARFGLAAAVGLVSGVVAVAFYVDLWGWVLSVIGLTAAVLAFPPGSLRLGFGFGWLAVLMLAVLGRPEGDWAVIGNLAGYGLIGVGLLHLGFLTATLPLRRRRSASPAP